MNTFICHKRQTLNIIKMKKMVSKNLSVNAALQQMISGTEIVYLCPMAAYHATMNVELLQP